MKEKKNFFIIIFFIISFYIVLKNKKKIIEDDLQSSFYVFSLLSPEEYNDAHIKGSICISNKQIKKILKKIKNKDTPIIFYAKNYYSSVDLIAAKQALDLGFLNVYVYKGGIASWYQAYKDSGCSEYFFDGEGKLDYLKIVIIPEAELSDLQEFEELTHGIKKYRLISTNNLQKILKEGKL